MSWNGVRIVFAGHFPQRRSRKALKRTLVWLGGRVDQALTGETRWLVCGTSPSPHKLKRARLLGIPVLLLGDFVAYLDGERPLVDAPAPELSVEPAAEQDVNPALGEARALLGEEPTRKTWVTLCTLVDQTSEGRSEVLVDYIFGHTQGWCDGVYMGDFGIPYAKDFGDMGAEMDAGRCDLRAAPLSWLQELLHGQSHMKHRLIRVLNPTELRPDNAMMSRMIGTDHLTEVRALAMVNAQLKASFFKTWANIGALPALRALTMVRTKIKAGFFKMLAKVQTQGLTHLNLAISDLDDRTIPVLARAGGALMGLTHLNVAACILAEPNLRGLGQGLGKLQFLNLDRNRLGQQGRLAAIDFSGLPALEHLSLCDNSLKGDGALSALANAPLASLRTIDLTRNGITPLALEGFLANPTLGRLRHFRFKRSFEHHQGKDFAALCRSPVAAQLESIDFGEQDLRGGTRALLEATHMTALRSLRGRIHPENLPDLFEAEHLQGLTHLAPGHDEAWVAKNPEKSSKIRCMVDKAGFCDAVKASLVAALTTV